MLEAWATQCTNRTESVVSKREQSSQITITVFAIFCYILTKGEEKAPQRGRGAHWACRSILAPRVVA